MASHLLVVKSVSTQEAEVVVHQFAPVATPDLRLEWRPLFVEGGTLVLGSGSTPSTEKVAALQEAGQASGGGPTTLYSTLLYSNPLCSPLPCSSPRSSALV